MILEKKAPLKERYVRYNQVKFMNKNLKKTEPTRSAYKRQRNFCVKLLRKTKKEFHNNLNVKYLIKNKLFSGKP